jgi:hypothetical protein
MMFFPFRWPFFTFSAGAAKIPLNNLQSGQTAGPEQRRGQ